MAVVDVSSTTPTRQCLRLFPKSRPSRIMRCSFGRNAPYMDSGATAHMVMNSTVLSMNKTSSSCSTVSASAEVVRAISEGTSEF